MHSWVNAPKLLHKEILFGKDSGLSACEELIYFECPAEVAKIVQVIPSVLIALWLAEECGLCLRRKK
jgi:hypothetical protein